MPPPPAANGAGCMPPNVTAKFASAYGKYYALFSTAGGNGADRSYVNAANDCATKRGQLAIFKDQYQQWLIESLLLPDNTSGVVDMYWTGGVRNYGNATATRTTNAINTTWVWGDTLQYLGPLPANATSHKYCRWAINQPAFTYTTGSPYKGCVVSQRAFAWDTVGGFPNFERRDGPMAVWAWVIEDCSVTRPYICELPCEWRPLHGGLRPWSRWSP
jgi:hypothetical protein